MRGNRPARLLAVAVVAAGLAGCTGTPGPAPTGMPDGLSVSLVQLRSDVADRQAQVQIRNDGDEPVSVTAVAVAAPGWAGVAERVVDRVTTVAPGRRVDVRVQLPAMDCAAADAASAVVTLGLERDGVGSEAVADIPDPLGFLPELHARECLGEALAEVAVVTVSAFTPSAPGGTGALTLAIAPTGSGSALLHAVDSTPLLMYAAGVPAAPFPLGIDIHPDSPATTVDIPLVPQRCDPHVVQEDKRGTIFTVDVTVGAVAGEVDLPAPPDMKARMLTWVADWCGFGAH